MGTGFQFGVTPSFTFSVKCKIEPAEEKPVLKLDSEGLPEGAKHVRTSDLARVVKMSEDLIRHHLRIGSFPEPKKRDRRGRLFTRAEVARLHHIRGRQEAARHGNRKSESSSSLQIGR